MSENLVEASLGESRKHRVMPDATRLALAESRPRRRGVEKDYDFYDPPETVLRLITQGEPWAYSFEKPETVDLYVKRDRAAMSLEYLGALRATELVRGEVSGGEKLSITSTQFNLDDADWVKLRGAINLKHRVQSVEDYPHRVELKFPRRGGLAPFTGIITDYLEAAEQREPKRYLRGIELFGFKRSRLYQIIRHTTGYGPHYLKAQGLKLVALFVNNNVADLKKFSGHTRTDNLVKYLHTTQLDQAMLGYTQKTGQS